MGCNDRRRFGVPALCVILAVLAATTSTLAQKPTAPASQNHLVLAADKRSLLQTALDGAPAAGLHVLFGSHDAMFLSRVQMADPPVAYRAIRENGSEQLERALNAAGEQSFRLIPASLTRSETRTTAIVRRAPGAAAPYRYRVVASNNLERDARDLGSKGFSIVGVFTQQSGVAATVLGRPGRLYVVLEASGHESTSAVATPLYRVVSALRASTVEKELNEAGATGYQVVGGSFMNVLLEKPAGNSREHAYRVIGAIRGTTLQSELEEAGRAGFRVVRTAIMSNPNSKAETVIVMERMPSRGGRFQYRWVSPSGIDGSTTLETLSAAGFAPIALWTFGLAPVDEFGNRPDVDVDDYYLLLEKR